MTRRIFQGIPFKSGAQLGMEYETEESMIKVFIFVAVKELSHGIWIFFLPHAKLPLNGKKPGNNSSVR